jgi:hypothetical protein
MGTSFSPSEMHDMDLQVAYCTYGHIATNPTKECV